MKNKLYYLLWVAYAAVIVFILQMNQVFTPGIERNSVEKLNIVINVAFLLLIGVLFVISTISFINVNKLSDSLSRVTSLIQKEDHDSYDMNRNSMWDTISNTKQLFGNEYLDKAMAGYRAQVRKNGNTFNSTRFVSIDDFINESLIEKAGKSFFNSAMAGTLTGLGILGTFIGLSLGLSSFSGDDIYTISDNVGPLLSGMKVAFHTSVYGIFFSLIFTFIYRGIMSIAYEKLDHFLTTFKHYTNAAIRENESASAMLIYQANTQALLKEILSYMKGTAKGQEEAMGAIVDRFLSQMAYTLNTDFNGLSQSLKDSSASQAASAEMFKNLTATTYDLVEVNRQMAETINAIAREQKELEHRLMRQEGKLDQTCDEISAKLLTFEFADDFRA